MKPEVEQAIREAEKSSYKKEMSRQKWKLYGTLMVGLILIWKIIKWALMIIVWISSNLFYMIMVYLKIAIHLAIDCIKTWWKHRKTHNKKVEETWQPPKNDWRY